MILFALAFIAGIAFIQRNPKTCGLIIALALVGQAVAHLAS